MNIYRISVSGHPQPIEVRASKARIALARALGRLTDSDFLNTAITIRFVGHVPKVWRVRAYVTRGDQRSRETVVDSLPEKPSELALANLQLAHPDWSYLVAECISGGRR